jgi:hypothetical protein
MERLHASGQTGAIKEIWNATKILVSQRGELFETAEALGVIGSSLWHEMGDVSKHKNFERFKKISNQKDFKKALIGIAALPLRTISKVGQVEQDLTQFREDILRMAVYLHSLKKIKAGQQLRHWAGKLSDVNEIAKTHPERAAAKMSRETLIDYGSFTPFENDVLRNGLMPFYSFFKRNATFWPTAIYNASKEGKGGKVGKIAATKAGFAMGKWLIRVLGMYAIAYLWNHRDEEAIEQEETMSFWERSRPHLNIADKTIWGQTALSDYMEWFDMDAVASVMWRQEAGFLTMEEAALEVAKKMAQAPVNRIAQAFNPFIKAPFTAVSGMSLWPSIFEPYFVASPASKRSLERAILDILGADANKFYQAARTEIRKKQGKGPHRDDRAFSDTLYAYFAGWWMRPIDPEKLAEQIKKTKEWSSLKSKSKTTGRKKGEAKKGKEADWQEAQIRGKVFETDNDDGILRL